MDSSGSCSGDVVLGVSDRDGAFGGPVARLAPGDRDQLITALRFAAEPALAGRKKLGEPDPLHARSRYRLRVAGEKRAVLDLADRVGSALRGGPVRRVRVGQELEVAPRSLDAPAGELWVDLVVVEPGCAEHPARDPHRRLSGMVDAADRVTGQRQPPDGLDSVRRGL